MIGTGHCVNSKLARSHCEVLRFGLVREIGRDFDFLSSLSLVLPFLPIESDFDELSFDFSMACRVFGDGVACMA